MNRRSVGQPRNSFVDGNTVQRQVTNQAPTKPAIIANACHWNWRDPLATFFHRGRPAPTSLVGLFLNRFAMPSWSTTPTCQWPSITTDHLVVFEKWTTTCIAQKWATVRAHCSSFFEPDFCLTWQLKESFQVRSLTQLGFVDFRQFSQTIRRLPQDFVVKRRRFTSRMGFSSDGRYERSALQEAAEQAKLGVFHSGFVMVLCGFAKANFVCSFAFTGGTLVVSFLPNYFNKFRPLQHLPAISLLRDR